MASLIETARGLCQWLVGRFRIRASFSSHVMHPELIHIGIEYAISARFNEGDPAYDWITLLLVRVSYPIIAFFFDSGNIDTGPCLGSVAQFPCHFQDLRKKVGRKDGIQSPDAWKRGIRADIRGFTAFPLEGILGRGQDARYFEVQR